jgi:anion-transporting  ArsA/GET3 family ATPase
MHEYAALSRLHELSRDAQWELVILDTPPTTHALDFLDAPRRMVRALESPAIHWFVRPYLKAGRLSLRLLGGARAYVLRRLAQIVGTGLLERIAEFLVLFERVLLGVRERIEAVSHFLQSGAAQYALVTSPTAANVQEAVLLAEQLARRRLPLGAVIVNRVHGLEAPGAGAENIAQALAGQRAVQELEPVDQLRLLKELTSTHRRFQRLAQADEVQIQRLLRRLPRVKYTARIPLMAEDVHDLGGLHRVASHL